MRDFKCETCYSYGNEYSRRGLVAYDTVEWRGRIPSFQRTLLPPFTSS